MTSRETAFLGIDLGSSDIRAGLVTVDGRLLGLARSRYDTAVDPERGTAEQDAETWWTGLVRTVRELVASTAVDVAGIAVAGHGPTLVAVDADGVPVRSAITWLDSRASRERDELGDATDLRGWALGIAPAALWLDRHEPASVARARWYLNSWEALTLRLTGVARTSVVPDQVLPSPSAMARLGLAVERLAPPIAVGGIVGGVTARAAAEIGLAPGVPVAAGLPDAIASFHGAGLLRVGDAMDAGGSAGGFGVYWDSPILAPGSFTQPAPLPGLFVVGGAMAATGRAVEWLRDAVLGGDRSTDALIDEAAHVPPGADGLVFVPYLAGERSPIWDPEARGAFVGLTLGHRREHLARAVLEASALAIRHVAEPILAAGVTVTAMRACGGPARSAVWNTIKADVTGFTVEVPAIVETAVAGAAIVAAVGTGAFDDLPTAIASMTRVDHRIEPEPARHDAYESVYRAYTAIHPALAPVLAILRRPVAEAVR